MFTQYQTFYVEAFENLFNSAALNNNEDVEKINKFIVDYTPLFAIHEVCLSNLQLKRTGSAQNDLVHENNAKILKLYGIAHYVYIRTCRALKRDADEKCGEHLIACIEDEAKSAQVSV